MDDRARAQATFADALDEVLGVWLERLGAEELARVMEVRLLRLRAAGAMAQALPETRVEWSPGSPERIAWSFGSSAQLEAQLDNIFKLQAICLEMEPAPEVLRDVALTVKAWNMSEGVLLTGRVVHRHKDQVAIQLDRPNLSLKASLDEIIHELKHGRVTIPAPVPNRVTHTPIAPTPLVAPPEPSGTMVGRNVVRDTLIASPLPTRTKRLDVEEEGGLIPLLSWIAGLKPTGLLELKASSFTLTLTMERGCVQDITRTPLRDQDSLERLLLGAGKLKPEEVKQAREHAEQYQISPGEALVDLALLEYGEVRVALKTRVLFMARQLWSGQFFEAVLTEMDRLPQRSLSLPVFLWSMLFRQTLESFVQRTAAELEALREPTRSMSIKRVEPLPCEVSQLELSAKHLRLLTVLLDEVRTEAELVSMAQMGRTEVLALLLTLRALGLIEEHVPNAALQRRTRQLDALTTAQARMGTQNHFEALGLHWSAFDEEIEAAYAAVRAQYDPETGEFAYIAEAKEVLAAVVAVVEGAYAELRYPGRRAAYRNQIVDNFKIRSSVEMFEKQIDMAKMRRDIDEALVFCKRILELQPGNAKAIHDLKLLETVKERQQQAGASTP